MAIFLDTQDLKIAIKDLFKDAETSLTIISPYIKLDEKIKRMIEPKITDPKFLIRVMFGKNEENKSKSMCYEDLEFFKKFQNVEIYYLEKLHAKYYANHTDSIITSMNLHSYSRENNIEVGVLFRPKIGSALLNKIASGLTQDFNADEQSFSYFYNLFEEADEIIYKKSTTKKKKLISLKKEFEEPVVEIDNTESFFKEFTKNNVFEASRAKEGITKGYCIRTREEIPFNMERPLSNTAFRIWSQFGDDQYPERYCHYSGEEANGKTCYAKPVLYHHYKKAVEQQNKIFK